MTSGPTAITSAAMLGRLLSALDECSADEIESDGALVTARVHLPSGDAYRITVEWLSEDSP